MPEVHLMTLDPGHFHAALVQKEMYEDVSPQVDVYAPLGPDLLAHLNRILGFNTRKDQPTNWRLDIHAGQDYLERMIQEKPGNAVVLSGRNDRKIHRMEAALAAGINVLADKPWILTTADFHTLQRVLDLAEARGLIALDIMTERHEITSILQKELVQDTDTFGSPVAGTEAEPGVFMESMHYLIKQVAGQPLRRPPWFFDIQQQGEGLTDVGTHLVDLVPWILFPNQGLDYRKDINVLSGKRWPTVMTCADFQQVTGEADFSDCHVSHLRDGQLDYYCNNLVSYKIRGIHVKLNILWDLKAVQGAGDTHFAVFRGTKASVEVRQGKEQNFKPELFVTPNSGTGDEVAKALQKKVQSLQANFPGVGVQERGLEWWITIPDSYRVGHEAHFAQVTNQFLKYLQHSRTLPAWEKPNMLAKYYVTTRGVELARKST